MTAARLEILDYHRRLSRFLRDSELSALNADPREVVPASALLRDAVRAALWAAEASGGLVDPCLLDALCAAGYDRSFQPRFGVPEKPAPSRPARAAAPSPAARWLQVRVDDHAETITRPVGLRLDLGGSGKGHIADLVARHFDGLRRWVVDCGGDLRVGGPRAVEIEHPVAGHPWRVISLCDGAVATSSIVKRAWVVDGAHSHHLLDPSTGEPAWTGLLSATALAPSVLEAETLAKTALLLGPGRSREVLIHGGLLVHGNGRVEEVAG